eukprot:c22426_g1_i2 orf=479-997(+)
MGWFWTTVVRLHTFGGYASVKAIESPSKEDDQQWLAYWILYSFVALLELAAAPLFAWIPLWSTIKLACACWLVLPPFHGAAFLYERFVRGELLKHQSRLDQKFNERQRRVLQLMSPEARVSVEHYIEDYGTEAFDKLIMVAAQQAQKNRLSPAKEKQNRYAYVGGGPDYDSY